MAESWKPSGAWNAAFRKALIEAFNTASFDLLIADYFLPETFDNLSPPGFNKPFANRLQEVINQARMDEWLLDLVAAAHERRPKNIALRSIAEDRGLTALGPRLNNPTGKTLEALVQANAKFINPAVFIDRLPELEGQVCWVDIPGHGGTGFLVGADLVLTNQHVVAPIVNNAANWRDVTCRFDFRRAADGTVLDQKKQVRVSLHSDDWLVDSAPPSDRDWDPALGDAGPAECDYALLRLAERVGEEPVGGATADAQARPRSWIDAAAEIPPLVAGNQVFVLQHAAGEVLGLTVGKVTGFNATGTRVRYDANSKKGSSGSPCFDADLRLVALHHAHDPNEPPAWNQAVPFAAIQKLWHGRGTVVP